MQVPEEFDNQILSKAFIMWLEDIKFSTACGLALQGKYACSSLSNQNI
jgi:hypothetical protein